MALLEWFQSQPRNFNSNNNALSIRTAFLGVILAYVLYRVIQGWRRRARDKSFGDKNGCLPMESWIPSRLPFALDILKKQYDELPNQRVLLLISQYFDNIGPNMTFKLLGNQGFLTADPKNIESILSTRFDDWCLGSRRAGLMPMLGEGIFTQDGRSWKHSRDLLETQFGRIHRQGLESLGQHVEELISKLRSSGGSVDLQPHLFRFTLATTTALLFGEPVYAMPGEETDTFEKAFDNASYISAIRLRLADLEWLYKPTKFLSDCAVVKKYASHFVQLALDEKMNSEKAASERHAFILDLYEAMHDPVLVRDQLVHVLIAGRDTTACLLSWAFFQLVRHPEVLARLREEIQVVTGGSTELTRAKITKMKYLTCVINETQRLYPQLPINIRVASKTTLLPSGGGPDGKSPVLVPEGTGIGYSVYHMHRLKSLYGEDANSFRPDRWLGPELVGIGKGFMPFHDGPRFCLGKEFALAEASYAIVRIIQAFPKLRLPPGTPVVPPGEERQALTIVVSSAKGCQVLLD